MDYFRLFCSGRARLDDATRPIDERRPKSYKRRAHRDSPTFSMYTNSDIQLRDHDIYIYTRVAARDRHVAYTSHMHTRRERDDKIILVTFSRSSRFTYVARRTYLMQPARFPLCRARASARQIAEADAMLRSCTRVPAERTRESVDERRESAFLPANPRDVGSRWTENVFSERRVRVISALRGAQLER